MKPSWQEMSKEELIQELDASESSRKLTPHQAEALLHDLHVQKVELEMRNFELRDSRRLLEESRSRYAELYDFAPIALCTLDSDGRIIEANLTFSALVGGDPTHLDRRILSTLVVPEDRGAFRHHLRRCMAERSRNTVEVRLALKELGVVHFQIASSPLHNEAGEAVACKTVLTDISALKRSEERMRLLAAASAKLSSSFDVLNTLSVMARTLVPAAADLCFVDLLLEDEPKRVVVVVADPARRAMAEALARAPIPRIICREAELVSRGGAAKLESMLADTPERSAIVASLQVHSMVVSPLLARDQQLGTLALAMCGSARAFTEADLAFGAEVATRAAMAVDNARLYHGAQRAIQARQEVLSIVSHDLKTPVTGILLSAEGVLAAAPASERRKSLKSIDRIRRTARQMEHIIDDLLDMAGLDTGHLSLQQSRQCVKQIIDEAIEQLMPLATEKEIAISVESVPNELWVQCDPNRLMQVLTNLVGNAIKFTPEHGAVQLTAGDFDGKVRISIRDNGPGIPSVVLRNLFQRYWQAKGTAHRGRGLGLFISKGIVEAQGGTIWVESKLSQGTTFHFTIPAAPVPAPALELLANPLVMVVEDDPSLRELVRDVLAQNGCGVTSAADGKEALEYLKTGGARPSLMLVDLNMPVMNGRDLMRAIRAEPKFADIPVVLLSSDEAVVKEALSLGAVDALKKPFDVSALLSVVKSRTPHLQA